jgi:hypothetical protein
MIRNVGMRGQCATTTEKTVDEFNRLAHDAFEHDNTDRRGAENEKHDQS